MRPLAGKISIAVVLMLIGGGMAIYIGNRPANVPKPSVPEAAPATPVVHSAAWYVAHPDVFREDEKRCAGNATTMSVATCQNVASADAQLNLIEMRNAATANQDAAPPVGADSKPK